MQKFLLLDGIAGVPLGEDLARALTSIDIKATHYNLLQMPKVPLYAVRSALAKLVNRARDKSGDTFFYLPKGKRTALAQIIKETKPDVILVIGFIYKFIEPAVLRALAEEHQIELYLYDTDSCNLYTKRREFIFFLEQELPIYRKIFSCSKVTADFFRHSRNQDAYFVPFGANFIAAPRLSEDDSQYDVLFVGSGDLRRIFVLESISKYVTIFGNRWSRNFSLMSKALIGRVNDRSVWGDELYTLLAHSKIVLNVTRGPYYAAGTGINLRIFEALAAGCFLLTDYCDEIAELFTPGVDIETFRSPQELYEKVAYYLEHPEQRMLIAKNGHAAFLKRYTWEHRAREIVTLTGR